MPADARFPRPLLAGALALFAAWLVALAWTWQHLDAPRGDVAPVAAAVDEQQREIMTLADELATLREDFARVEDQRDALAARVATLESASTTGTGEALAAAPATPTPSPTPTTVAAQAPTGPTTVAAGAPPDAFSPSALPGPVGTPEPLGRFIGSPDYPIDTGGANLYDCRDFLDWKQADFIYRVNLPGDPNHLDPDGDGLPCEELPNAGDASVPAVTLATPTLEPTPASTPVAQ